MTREEAIKFLSNTKVYVNGKSKEIQEKLFSLGFQWKSEGKQILNTDMPFLFAWNDMNICYSNDMEHFVESEFKEITVNDILNIVIDKPKYRPFNNAKECFEEMRKHEPFGWVRSKDSGKYFHPICYSDTEVKMGLSYKNTYDVMIKSFTFLDGSPFGIKKE